MNTTVKKIEALEELLKGGNITPTIIYNEGWMLRLVLNWLSEHRDKVEHPDLKFLEKSKWFSEAALPTFFSHENVGEGYETYTHADGVFGDFHCIDGKEYKGKNYIELDKECNQFAVIEAKIFSKYSKGNTNGASYNQVARTIACMYHLAKTKRITYENLAFYTFLPDYKDQNKKDCDEFMNNNFRKFIRLSDGDDSILGVVKKRIETVEKNIKDKSKLNNIKNFDIQDFEKFLNSIKIKLIFWEYIIELIKEVDKGGKTYAEMQLFYNNCKKHNKKN